MSGFLCIAPQFMVSAKRLLRQSRVWLFYLLAGEGIYLLPNLSATSAEDADTRHFQSVSLYHSFGAYGQVYCVFPSPRNSICRCSLTVVYHECHTAKEELGITERVTNLI